MAAPTHGCWSGERTRRTLSGMTTTPTRTTNPLPFEHLEPKRFEDLVRQLAYDFRPWRQLEATGRAGSDAGFDARGWEARDLTAPRVSDAAEEIEGEAEDAAAEGTDDRLWLIQCKRERTIGPAAMLGHLEAMPTETFEGLYGLVFVAACDLSKGTRDACRDWCGGLGVQEIHVWGRAELEDLLYQPKNDHLLFAYFGISLQIRRRSAATALRRITTVKRKLKRLLDKGQGWPGTPVIVRDPADTRFPWTGRETLQSGRFLWRPFAMKSLGPQGLRLVVRCFHGFYRPDTKEWDVASALNRALPHEADDLWRDADASTHALSDRVIGPWSRLPEHQQVFLFALRDLAYEDVLEIDEVGDDFCELPTIFATFRDGQPPLAESGDAYFEMRQFGERSGFRHEHRVRLFADDVRDAEWEKRWADATGGALPNDFYEVQMSSGTIWRRDGSFQIEEE